MIYNQTDLKRIIAKVLGCDCSSLNETSGLSKTFNWDSLNHVIILSAIEEYFNISIKNEFFPKLLTIGDIICFLNEYELDLCFNNDSCPCEDKCFTERTVLFNSIDGTPLNGVYCFANGSPKGLALLTHGIPADKNEGGFYSKLAINLAKNGYDSFRFDFRYMGDNHITVDGNNYNIISKSELAMRLSIRKLIEDMESAYNNALRQRDNFTFDKLFGIAISCSGGILIKWINDMHHSDTFNGLLLCCPVMDYVYECTGCSYEEVDVTSIKEQLSINGYIPDRDAMYGEVFFDESLVFNADKEIKSFGKRIVIYHGDKDQCVPVEFSIKIAKNNKNVDLILIPNARHGFSSPSLDSNGNKLSKDTKLVIKTKNRGEVINSICCTLRGWDNV